MTPRGYRVERRAHVACAGSPRPRSCVVAAWRGEGESFDDGVAATCLREPGTTSLGKPFTQEELLHFARSLLESVD